MTTNKVKRLAGVMRGGGDVRLVSGQRVAGAAAGRVIMEPGYSYRVYRDRGARDGEWTEQGSLTGAEASELALLGARRIAA